MTDPIRAAGALQLELYSRVVNAEGRAARAEAELGALKAQRSIGGRLRSLLARLTGERGPPPGGSAS